MSSQGGFPLQCKVCCKSFSGPAPAHQHFNSNEHKKKELNSRRAAHDPCYCQVCNISCDTPRILENHVQSPRHLAMVERQQQHIGNPSNLIASENTTAGNANNGSKEYVFNGTRGYCYVCQLELTSQSHAQDHLKGQKHAKKKRQVDVNKTTNFLTAREEMTTTAVPQPEYYCEICKVPFSGPESAQQHYSSEKHRKKENLAKQGQQQELKCDLCNVIFTGEENLHLHNMSDKHKRKVKLQEQKERGELLPLICEICACSFSGQENAKQHFESQKHKRNLQNKQIQDRVNLTIAPTSNTSAVQKPVNTYQQTGDLDKVTSGINKLNIANSQDHLKKFQHITKLSQLEREEQDLIKPFPVESQGQERSSTAVVQDGTKLFEPDIIPRNESNKVISAFENQRHLEHYYTQPQIHRTSLHMPETPSRPNITERSYGGDGDSSRSIPSCSDEEKIKQEMRSMTSISTSLSGSSVDSFSKSDEPVRVIRNNLLSSLPVYGRGRAFIALKNSNLLVGEQKNIKKEHDCTEPTLIETTDKNDGFDRYSPMFGGTINSNLQNFQNTFEQTITRNQGDENRNASVSKEIPDIIKPFRSASNEAVQPTNQIVKNVDEFHNKPEMDPIIVGDPPAYDQIFGANLNERAILGNINGAQPSQMVEGFQEEESEEFVFDRFSNRGKCHVCNIELTSVNHMTQHTTGGKHRKAAEVWRQTQTGSHYINRQLVCTLCNVTFSGFEARDQHNRSERHLHRERIASGREKSLYCHVCKVACSGEISYQQHLIGSQHRKLLGLSDLNGNAAMGIDRTNWYRCDVCNCNLNSFEQLEIHERSPRHLAKMRSMGVDSDSDGSTSPFNLDRTRWYTCNVCLCKLNSAEQLRIHEMSPGHLKRIQKPGHIDGHPVELSPEYQYQSGDNLPSFFDRGDNSSMTPLESFLSIELFPQELSADDSGSTDNTEPSGTKQASSNTPFNLVVSDSPIPHQEKFADIENASSTLNCSQGEQSRVEDEVPSSGGKKRGQGSDLAWATRSRGNADRKSESLSDKDISPTDAPHYENVPFIGGLGAWRKERSPSREHVNPYAATHKFYCHTCKAPMNTRESYENHLRGKRHMQKVCTEPAPIRSHHDIKPLPEMYKPQTVTSPRNYQVELYKKAMNRDALCFLPTGTGKTLVSVLVMSAMLEKQPSRNVLFLVDKVLLVLQQSKYIKKELQGFHYARYNTESEDMGLVRRHIQVAAVCMGQQNTGGVPLWKHDVVVVTAAFCQNLLDKNILRWQDFSLVVFDEAHHCEKAHPYNALLQTFHSSIPSHEFRPKILGLTASPAGKADVPKTLQMLEGLISNMGGVNMTVVEEPDNIHTLREYQSNARMIIHTQKGVDKIADTSGFIHEINVYIVHCYLKLSQISNIDFFINTSGVGLNSVNIRTIADSFVERHIDVLQSCLASLSSNNMETVSFALLLSHVREICMAGSSLDEGVLSMIEDFIELENTDYGFQFAKSVGLPCQGVEELVHRLASEDQTPVANKADVNTDLLLRVLTDNTGGTRKDRTSSISLVLVKMRGTAFRVTRILKQSPELRSLGLDTATVVGHGGSGAMEKGMSVNQQKRVLEDIKQYKYQIIVATSVAEEGVDWPECERVISMYPPSTVTALVQMRGRARRKNSQFVILCASQAEEDKLRDIINREQNMIQATQILVERDKQYASRQT